MSVTSTIDIDALLQGISETRRLKRFTRDDCELFERLGKLPDRYELLEGQIVLVMSQRNAHALVVMQLILWLAEVYGGARIRSQTSLAIDDYNLPEPDCFVLNEPFLAGEAYPGAEQVILVAEASHTTLRDDLQVKANLYARAGVPEYWVIDIRGRQLFVHTDPQDGAYQTVQALTENETITAPGKRDAGISVARLLPPVDDSE